MIEQDFWDLLFIFSFVGLGMLIAVIIHFGAEYVARKKKR